MRRSLNYRWLLGRGTDDAAEWNLEGSGEVGVGVEDSAAESEAAIGDIDIQVEVDAVGLHLGIAGRVHIEVEVSDDPVERLAFVVVDEQGDFDFAVARAVGRRIELEAAGGDDEVHPVAGERGFEIGVVSGGFAGSACPRVCSGAALPGFAAPGWAAMRCTRKAIGIWVELGMPGPMKGWSGSLAGLAESALASLVSAA